MIARRIAAVGAVLTVGALALSGCSGSANAGGNGSDEPIELSMLVNITPNLTEEWWNDLVAPFEEANPNIDVKIQAPSQEGVRKTLPQLLAAGNVPDVIQSIVPSPELVDELVDLSDYKWASEAPLADQYTLDGKNYNAMIGYQLQSIMFYNKQAFKDAGIESPPETLDELGDDLKKLKDAGWTPIQTGGDWFTQMTAQSIGLPTIIAENPDWFADMSSGDATFSETYGDTIKLYADWVAKGYVPADAVATKYPDAEAAFLAGTSAIYPMGSWFASAEAKATDKPEIGVFRSPAAKGVDDPAMGAGGASSYVIMKQSKHQEAGAKLVEYLVTDKDAVTAQLAVDGNYRPGYDYEMDPLQKELLQIVEDTPIDSFTPTGDGYGSKTVPLGYAAELNTQLQGILTGASADSVLAAMDAWFEANR
jgi:ABC-type glycerol-3-phosphate transport system substrate-binding protein